jgi:anti-anti-sigma factor
MSQEAAAQELKLEIHRTDEETVVVCAGKINSNTHGLLHRAVKPLISGTKRIVLDLRNVSHVDSRGIGELVRLWISTKRENCELRVIHLSERIQELLRVSNLAKIFEGDQEYHKYLGG